MDQSSLVKNQIPSQNSIAESPAPTALSTAHMRGLAKPFYRQWYFWTNLALLLIAIIGWVMMSVTLTHNQRMRSEIAELETEMEIRTQLLVKYGAELGLKTDQYFRALDTKSSQNTTKK